MPRHQTMTVLWALVSVSSTLNIHTSADTQVGGAYRGTTKWSRSDSPYVAVQNVEVPAGATLTIEPGVEIRFADHAFIVRGTLIARATKDAPILITSKNADSPAPQDWGLMQFEKPSSGSIMEHVVVEYGHGLFLNGAAPEISHCTIRYHRKERGGGVYAYGCKPVIRDSVISNNIADSEGGGIRMAHCEPLIVRNTIAHNSARFNGGGISLDYAAAKIEDNTICHNFAAHGAGLATGETQVGQTSVSGRSHSSPRILNNRITHNTAYYSGGGVAVRGTPEIVGNTIACNRIHLAHFSQQPSNEAHIERKVGAGAGVKVVETYGGPLRIQRNLIVGNRGAFWGAGMCFDRAAGTISENLVAGNQATIHGGAISILVRTPSSGPAGGDHGREWNIVNNEFRGNVGGVFELARARFGGEQSIRVSGCNLVENSGAVFVNRTKNSIRAPDNWWGTDSEAEINQQIDDFFDNQRYGQVSFQPVDGRRIIAEMPELDEETLANFSHWPKNVRAGQGFSRMPGTPPSVTVVWNSGELENPAGYRVYFSRIEPRFERFHPIDDMRIPASSGEGASPVDAGNVTRTVITGLEIGQTYEFAVTAYDSEGRESAMSDGYIVDVKR